MDSEKVTEKAPIEIPAIDAAWEAECRGMDAQEITAFVLGACGGSHRGRGRLKWRRAVDAGRIWREAETIRRAPAKALDTEGAANGIR